MLVRGDLVHCPELGKLEILQDHVVDIGYTGLIDYIGPATTPDAIEKIAASAGRLILVPKGSFLLPTFCDLHLHAPQFLYQGTGLHLPLMKWLDEYAFKAEERIDADPSLAHKVYTRLAERLIEHGTGAVLLFGTIKEETNLILAKCMMNAGIRAFVGKLSMDISSRPSYIEASAAASLTAVSSFADKCIALNNELPPGTTLVEPVLTPRFVPTCSDELLLGLGKLSKAKNLRVQSHMAEAYDQVEWVRAERGVEDMEVFERSGLLTPRTVQAHCTFLDPPSLSHVAKRGTAVAHCPLSNAYFSAEPFRLREALNNGVKVGLGTDIAGGYHIDILSSMRQAVAVSRMREGARIMGKAAQSHTKADGDDKSVLSIDWTEALYLATRGGALALGLTNGVGTFMKGASFDAQCSKHPID
ncbi:hypothetical protein NM688_g1360 [Phlebia brevispora]|uniref:Uncharacterized protein n=1 Tax=Phlebia brevispora TaxID=194682 RepID=A0ACC1TBD6_9APHY|nr:hypothetical protein NM688_g1360 [Phlebia brevispora]